MGHGCIEKVWGPRGPEQQTMVVHNWTPTATVHTLWVNCGVGDERARRLATAIL